MRNPRDDPDARRRQLALFRFGIIGDLDVEALPRGERSARIVELAARPYRTPDGRERRFSARTLWAWWSAYRRQGIDGLLPQRRRDRGTLKAFSPELLEASIALRRELPSRSTPTLIAILEMQDRVARGQLRRATLDRHLADAGVARRRLKPLGDKRYIRLLFQRPNQLWVGDYHESIGGIKAIVPAHRPPAPPAPSRTGPARQGAARLARELQAHAPCTTRRSATDGLRQPPGPQGLITERDVAGEIGEVIVGKKPAGRRRRSSPSSTRRGSRCRTRRRCPSSTSARSPPASASKRR